MKLELERTLNLPTGVLGLAGSSEGKKLYAACMDGFVYQVEIASGESVALPGKHSSYASSCVLLPREEILISAGYDGQLIWHDLIGSKTIRTLQAHDFWSWKLALSSDGRRVASVSGQYQVGGEKYEPAPAVKPTVKVFDTETGELIHALMHTPPVQAAAISPDGQFLAAGNMMGEVAVWNLITAEQVATFKSADFTSWGIIKSPHYLGGIFNLTFSPDGADLYLCGMGPMADPMAGNGKMTWQRWAWRESPTKPAAQIHDGEHGSGLMEVLEFAPDKRSFLMGGRQAQGTWNVALFSADEGKLMASLDTKSRVTRSYFAPESNRLFLAAAVGQGARKDGKWPDYGRIHLVTMEA